VLSVGVRRLGGDQDCQGNPRTPYRVDLESPVGDRDVRSSEPPSGSDDGGMATTLTTREPTVTVVRASETSAMSPTWVETRCDSGGSSGVEYLPVLEDPAEYRTAEMVVAAAVEHYELSAEGWHVLRVSSPGARDSSWWTQYRDGAAVAEIRVEPGLIGWSGHTAVCVGLGDGWVPDRDPGEIDSFTQREAADRLQVDDWLESVDGLQHDGSGWRFERPNERCPTWIGIESVAIANGATLTFTDWFGQWPNPINTDGGSVLRHGAMGVALDGRGVMLVTDGDRLIQHNLAKDLVWEDTSSPIPCLLDEPIPYAIDAP
jgi:hypothetical protein